MYPHTWAKSTPPGLLVRDAGIWSEELSPLSQDAIFYQEKIEEKERHFREKERREGEIRPADDFLHLQEVIDALCVATELLRQDRRGREMLTRVELSGATAWADDVIQDFLADREAPALSRLGDISNWLHRWFKRSEASPFRAMELERAGR